MKKVVAKVLYWLSDVLEQLSYKIYDWGVDVDPDCKVFDKKDLAKKFFELNDE